jgi:AraC-like DNA-binding protein
MLIRSQAVGPILSMVEARGGDVGAMMQRFELEPAARTEAQCELPIARLRALFAEAAALTGDDSFGLHTALALPRGRYGLVEYGAMSAPTLGDAVRRLGRLSALVNPASRYTLDEGPASWRFSQRFPGLPGGLGRHGNEFNVVAIVQMGRAILREAWAPRSAWFSSAPPADTAPIERTLGTTELLFDRDSNGIEIPLSLVERPIPTADAALLALMDHYAALELEAIPRGDTLIERVSLAVRGAMQGGAPRLEDIARSLKMGPRTLQRRLEAEGTPFSGVVESVRRQLAITYLTSSRQTLAEIAFTLGYSDMPSFLRAFRRWTGETPTSFRARSAAGRTRQIG